MTLKQKIENLTWADLIKKLKDILGNFSTKFDNLTGRISTLESSSGEIPTPGLQDVLDKQSFASYPGAFLRLLAGANYNKDFILNLDNGTGIDTSIEQHPDSISIKGNTPGAGANNARMNIDSGKVQVYQSHRIANIQHTTNLNFVDPTEDTILSFPAKTVGTYTLATLEDISKYKVYSAKFDISGGNAIPVVYENTLGDTVTWTTNVPGSYSVTIPGGLFGSSYVVIITDSATTPLGKTEWASQSNSELTIIHKLVSTGAIAEPVTSSGIFIEIRVYN